MDEIILPYANNAQFNINDLINYFRGQQIKYMIIGARFVVLKDHPYSYSLDVWLRTHPNVKGYENTCQAIKEVINQIIKHNQFSKGLRIDPKTGRMRKALVFCDNILN
jgi:hypothetical protein